MRDELTQQIDSLLANNTVVLFMKGTKERPQCGFSKQVVGVLQNLCDFVAIDVLADPELREGIKVYSSWPTIPQLYINREFIGGCDIVLDLYRTNELHKLLSLQKASQKPTITISDKALAAFKNAQADSGDTEHIRISIAQNFEHGLSFDEQRPDDFVLSYDGFSILMDPYSAALASGLHIDYVQDNLEAGFAFENPNEPPAVEELSVEELKAWHDMGKDFVFIDVRPKAEWDMAHIGFAKTLFSMSDADIAALKKDQALVFHCHHGSRSRRIGESWRTKGFTKIYNLTGGIDAWSRQIDRTVPVYTK